MEALRQYVLSVTAAAVICGIVSGLCPKGSIRESIRLLCGMFLAFTVMSPLSSLDIDSFMSQFTFYDTIESETVVAVGKELSAESIAEIIKAKTEAYILDKAAELEADLAVEVTLSQDELPVPVAVILQGEVSASTKQKLSQIISKDLGIKQENQQWNG